MTNINLIYKGVIAYSENDNIYIVHYTLGKYQVLIYSYKGYRMQVIKYTNIPELFQDFRRRLYHLSVKQGRNILYTDYGKECIKNWYKITNG